MPHINPGSQSHLASPQHCREPFICRKESRFVGLVGPRDASTYQSHRTYGHFIENVLARAFDLLHPLMNATSSTGLRDHMPPKRPNIAAINNQFAALTIEDTVDGDVPTSASLLYFSPVEIDFDDSEIKDEFFLAIKVFLGDVYYVRQLVLDKWKSYKESQLENSVVSLYTNTAIDVIRLAEQAHERLVKGPDRFPASKFPVWSLPALCFHRDNGHIFASDDLPEDPTKFCPIMLPPYTTEIGQSDVCLFSVYAGLN